MNLNRNMKSEFAQYISDSFNTSYTYSFVGKKNRSNCTRYNQLLPQSRHKPLRKKLTSCENKLSNRDFYSTKQNEFDYFTQDLLISVTAQSIV